MRFTLGVVVGVFLAKPVHKLIDDHLTPPVRKKIKKVVNDLAKRLNDSIDKEEDNK